MLAQEGARVLAWPAAAPTLELDVTDPDAGRARWSPTARAAGRPGALVNNAGTSRVAPARRAHRRGLAGAVGAARDGADAADEGRWRRAWPRRGGGRIVNVCSSSGKRPSLTNAAYSVTKAAAALARRASSPTPGRARACWSTRSRRGRWRRGLWTDEGGLADQVADAHGIDPRGGARRQAREDPARALGHRGRDRGGDRLPLLGAGVERDRRRLVGGRRRVPMII